MIWGLLYIISKNVKITGQGSVVLCTISSCVLEYNISLYGFSPEISLSLQPCANFAPTAISEFLQLQTIATGALSFHRLCWVIEIHSIQFNSIQFPCPWNIVIDRLQNCEYLIVFKCHNKLCPSICGLSIGIRQGHVAMMYKE